MEDVKTKTVELLKEVDKAIDDLISKTKDLSEYQKKFPLIMPVLFQDEKEIRDLVCEIDRKSELI